MPSDVNGSASDNEEESDAQSNTSTLKSQLDDAKRRLSGQTKTVDKLTRKIAELETALDNKTGAEEEAGSKLRNELADIKKQFKEKSDALEAANVSKATYERQLKVLQDSQKASTKIAEKHPDLLRVHMTGDLKNPTDFEKEEEYDKYLDRMAKLFNPASDEEETEENEEENDDSEVTPPPSLKDRMKGSTPAVGVGVRGGKTKGRSVADVTDDLMIVNEKLNRNPNDEKALDQQKRLYAELDTLDLPKFR